LRDHHAASHNEPGDRSGGGRPEDSARSDESSRHSCYLQADADQLVTIEPKPGWIRTWQSCAVADESFWRAAEPRTGTTRRESA
jgi:hypothetical protein